MPLPARAGEMILVHNHLWHRSQQEHERAASQRAVGVPDDGGHALPAQEARAAPVRAALRLTRPLDRAARRADDAAMKNDVAPRARRRRLATVALVSAAVARADKERASPHADVNATVGGKKLTISLRPPLQEGARHLRRAGAVGTGLAHRRRRGHHAHHRRRHDHRRAQGPQGQLRAVQRSPGRRTGSSSSTRPPSSGARSSTTPRTTSARRR